jgi:hypothetical protein
MRETMADFMAVWAQSANAYRRYVLKAMCRWPRIGASTTARSRCGFHMAAPAATRIEHRVLRCRRQSYLVMASILADGRGIATIDQVRGRGQLSGDRGAGCRPPGATRSISSNVRKSCGAHLARRSRMYSRA